MDGLHIGLVGVGRIGAMHARTLGGNENIARLTIADADADRARLVADELDADAAETPEALVAAGIDARHRHCDELAAFVTAVLEGRPSPCSLEDARAALAVAVAAERSCAERRPVRIDE